MINAINVTLKKIKVDSVGALVSGLCMVHWLATPVFFIASACTASCCNLAPAWWQALDYFFLFVSLFAVFQATRTSTNPFISSGLWVSWIGLAFFILNTKYAWISVHANIKFIPAFFLIGLHLYNMKYCQCESNECC